MRDLDEDSYVGNNNSHAKSHRDKSSIIEIDLQKRGGHVGANITTMSQQWKKGLSSEVSSDNLGNASNLWHRKRSVC